MFSHVRDYPEPKFELYGVYLCFDAEDGDYDDKQELYRGSLADCEQYVKESYWIDPAEDTTVYPDGGWLSIEYIPPGAS